MGIACIEATIPFRSKVGLQNRVVGVLRKSDFFVETCIDINMIMQACSAIVESDLSSFASADLTSFVSDSWNVILENNPKLREEGLSPSEYRAALIKARSFYVSLDLKSIFWEMIDKNTENNRLLVIKKNISSLIAYLDVLIES